MIASQDQLLGKFDMIKKIMALGATLILAACSMGTVSKDFSYTPTPETALIVFFEPSVNGAVFKAVDLEAKTFVDGRVSFNGAPSMNAPALRQELVDLSPDKSKSYSQIFYTDKDGQRHYMGKDIKGFMVEEAVPGDYALTTRMPIGGQSFYCDNKTAGVYRIQPGKANLVIGKFPYPLPDDIQQQFDADRDVKKLFENLKSTEEKGLLTFGDIPKETEDRILAELKRILPGYPGLNAEAVLAERVADISFDGKVSWFDGSGCPAEKDQPFTIADADSE